MPTAISSVIDFLRAKVSTAKAHRLLGYEPAVPQDRAMELTLQWLRAARLVP